MSRSAERGRREEAEPARSARRWGYRGRTDARPGPAGDVEDPLVDLFAELDQLRATVHRQSVALRDEAARVARERAAAQADEHRRVLVAVRALARQATDDPTAGGDVRAYAARIEAAVARLEPESALTLTWGSARPAAARVGTVRGQAPDRRDAQLPAARGAERAAGTAAGDPSRNRHTRAGVGTGTGHPQRPRPLGGPGPGSPSGGAP